jgi:hypothetical protein
MPLNMSVRSCLAVVSVFLSLAATPYARAQNTYDVSLSPAVDASVCNNGQQAGFNSQIFTTDQSGHFSTVWSTSTPVVSVVGDVTNSSVSATMSCLNTGSGSGSIQASRPGSTGNYTGTYSFNSQTGQVTISRQLPTISIADVAIAEGNSGTKLMTFTLTLSFASTSPITYNIFTVDDTAKAGSDYVASNLVGQSIPAGQTTATFSVTINGDTFGEANELFNVYLSNVSGATVPDNFTVGRIDNDDAASLYIDDVTLSEGDSGTKLATFTVSLVPAAATAVTYDIATLSASPQIPKGVDFVPKSLVGEAIPAGQTSKSFTVTVNGDTVNEQDEYFVVELSNASGATIADPEGIGTILNDDPPPSLSIDDAALSEGNSGTKLMTFTVKLSGPTGNTVNYQVKTGNGTATAGSDYVAKSISDSMFGDTTSKTFTVTINGDTTTEPDETFGVYLISPDPISDDHAIGTILNDDTPTLSIADVSISEGNSGSKLATFTVSLSTASANAVTYNIATADASAKAGIDYTASSLNGEAIPAGQTSRTFTVPILGDTTVEPNKGFVVNVTSVVGATVTDGVANGIILNDDGPTLSIGDISTAEGNSGTTVATFTVRLSQAAAVPVTYNIATADGSGKAASDYVAKNLVGETIPAGQLSKTFTVTLNGDQTLEQNETYYVSLSGASGATIMDSTAIGYIVNDDGPTLSINDAAVTEGNSGTKLMTFTVTLSQAAETAVTYNLATSNVTATAGSDYVAVASTPQSIPAGTLSKTFNVTINGDTAVEPNETFYLTLTNPYGATKFDGTGIGTITNDDGAALRVARVATGGLYDDIDDGNGAPRLSMNDYALLLQDTAQRICKRAGTATIVAVDGVENRAVLDDLADATNLTCSTQPHYAAVMVQGDSRGFLIEVPTTPNTRGLQVLGQPEMFTDAGSTALSVLGVGQSQPITVLLASAADGTAEVRRAQAQALAQRVQQRFVQNANANVIVLGANAVNGLVDLTVRAQPPANRRGTALPNDRILVSPGLLRQFRAQAEFVSLPPTDEPAQYLQLQQ